MKICPYCGATVSARELEKHGGRCEPCQLLVECLVE